MMLRLAIVYMCEAINFRNLIEVTNCRLGFYLRLISTFICGARRRNLFWYSFLLLGKRNLAFAVFSCSFLDVYKARKLRYLH